MSRVLVAAWLGVLALGSPARAHELRPAYLEVKQTAPARWEVLWRTPVLSGMRLPVALKFSEGVRDVGEPTVQELTDSLVERRAVEAGANGLAGQRIEFVGLQGTITDVLVRVEAADGRASTTLVTPSQPWVEIAASQPVTFPMVMAFGGMLGLMGVALPGIEIGIALSAVALGLAVCTEARPALWLAALLVGFFAVFHGNAHGTELPPGADAILYSIGFVVATGTIHATGIGLGLVHRWPIGRVALRAAGAGVALAGVAFLVQAVGRAGV